MLFDFGEKKETCFDYKKQNSKKNRSPKNPLFQRV